MSFMVDTYEILEVNTSTEESIGFVKHIADYVEQFNHMRSLESLSGFKMTITTDGKETTLECDDLWEPNNTYVVTEEGCSVRTVEHTFWSAEIIDALLVDLAAATTIKIKTHFNIMCLFGHDYGYCYWTALLDENSEALREHVSYKCLEYYDSELDVIVYQFTKDFAGTVEYDSTAEDVAHITSWFSDNFEMCACIDEDYDDETIEMLAAWAKNFEEKYNLLNKIEPPSGEEFAFGESLTIAGDFDELAADLQEAIDALTELDADIELSCTFVPDETYDFALVELVIEDGQVVVKYCAY